MSTEINLLSKSPESPEEDECFAAVGAESPEGQGGCARAGGTAHHLAAAAQDMARITLHKVGGSLTNSREFVRRNPVPVILGAVAFGAVLDFLLMPGRRTPSLAHRYLDEPFDHARVALLAALAPVTHRLHDGYDLAVDGAERALERVQELRPRNPVACFAQRIARFGSRLIAR